MTYRRPDDTDEDWKRRRQLSPLRAEVLTARNHHETALLELRKFAWRARYVTVALVTGVLSLLGIIGIITLERWFDGFAPYLGVVIPLTVIPLVTGLMFTDEYEKRADRRAAVTRTDREYRERYAEYVDAGGGGDVADALLPPLDVPRR